MAAASNVFDDIFLEQIVDGCCHLVAPITSHLEPSGRTVWQPGTIMMAGACLNIKTVSPRYGDSHVKDKTVARPSYL